MATLPQRFSRWNWRKIAWQGMLMSVTLFAVVVIIFPIIWMIFASVRPVEETLTIPPVWFPKQFTLHYYHQLLNDSQRMHYLTNGYIISIMTAGLCLAGSLRFFPVQDQGGALHPDRHSGIADAAAGLAHYSLLQSRNLAEAV
jgi:ABC-type spermidine/putrescine transport system permease subunit I